MVHKLGLLGQIEELSPSHSENEISQDLGSTHQSSIPLLIDARADGWWMSCKAEQLHTMLYIYKFEHGHVTSRINEGLGSTVLTT